MSALCRRSSDLVVSEFDNSVMSIQAVRTLIFIALLPLAVYFQLDDLCSIAAGQLIDSITEEHVVEIAGLLKKFSSHECIHWALAELMGCVKR